MRYLFADRDLAEILHKIIQFHLKHSGKVLILTFFDTDTSHAIDIRVLPVSDPTGPSGIVQLDIILCDPVFRPLLTVYHTVSMTHCYCIGDCFII